MGIPLYFRFLTTKYPDTIRNLEDFQREWQELYFDLNGLIHPSCSKARKQNPNVKGKALTGLMLHEVRQQIKLIMDLIKPTTYTLLSVDGVAPLAKINQQRSRRYKSYVLNKLINRIKEKYGEAVDTWDTNAISPGTDFMNFLMHSLQDYVDKVMTQETTSEVELSTSNVPGEGEHKIFTRIRNSTDTRTRIVYGLDADLIMLSLASNKKGIYLLRESVHFGKVNSDQMLLLDIDALREAICTEIRGFLSVAQITNTQIVKDYLYICFLLGNDFLPHLPPLRIGEGSVDYLLNAYAEALNRDSENPEPGLIGPNRTLNLNLFRDIMRNLSQDESSLVSSFYQSHIRKRYHEPQGLTSCESEIRKIEFMPSVKRIKDTVHMNQEGWEERYYQRYLCQKQVKPIEIEKMCENYWQGLMWTLDYYMEECPSWHWFYHYPCSPTVRDLSMYLNKQSDESLLKNPFPRGPDGPIETALDPQEQMLCILPPGSATLVPPKLKSLMLSTHSPIKDLYPSSFNVEMLYMRYFHQAIPQLPLIDFKRIQEAIQSC